MVSTLEKCHSKMRIDTEKQVGLETEEVACVVFN